MIPVLDGSNYGAWSKVMCAFLRAQGLWQYINSQIERPDVLDPKKSTEDELKANKVALNEWDRMDNMAIGHMTLCLSASIQEEVSSLNTAFSIWDCLENHYAKATPTTIYKDFKEALSVHLHANQNPSPSMDKMAACFQCLMSVEVDVPEQIRAMMLLTALPQKWEMLVSIITQQCNLDSIKFVDVRNTVLAQFQSKSMHSNRGQCNKGQNQGQQANKLSVVKHKHNNPNFSNQQQGEGSQHQNQQNGDRSKCQHGQRSKGKQHQQQQGNHSHLHIADPIIVSTPSVPALTTATIVEVTSASPSKRKLTTAPPAPSEHTPRPYPSLNKALDLADHIGVKPTIQVTKMLEECIQKQYNDGPWSKGTYTLGKEPDNEDVDMSIVPPGAENQEDWVFKEADPSPSYNLPSEEELLDWGSADEDEACVPSSLHFHNIHKLPAFLQTLKGERLLKDGCTKHSSVASAFSLDPYMSIHCEHGHSYAECLKCKGNCPVKWEQCGCLILAQAHTLRMTFVTLLSIHPLHHLRELL